MGTATVAVSAGVDAGFSMLRSERQARKIAREAVSRAVSRIDSMTRETRTRRELMRTEQGFAYKLDNDTGKNLHGVYRWVDRIDTYQVFSYPNRLMLEFQIPDPAESYRWRTDRADAADTDKPPDWDLKLGDIATDRLIELAAKYRATNLPAPPDGEVSVVRTLSVEPGKEWEPSTHNANVLNPPTASKELEIPIPANYEAVSVSYEGAGYPAQAQWVIPVVGKGRTRQEARLPLGLRHRFDRERKPPVLERWRRQPNQLERCHHRHSRGIPKDRVHPPLLRCFHSQHQRRHGSRSADGVSQVRSADPRSGEDRGDNVRP